MLEKIGSEGFEAHLKGVQAKYARKAEVITKLAEKHLKDLAEWEPLKAGMFMWLRLKGIKDSNDILPALKAQKVILVPGKLYFLDKLLPGHSDDSKIVCRLWKCRPSAEFQPVKLCTMYWILWVTV